MPPEIKAAATFLAREGREPNQEELYQELKHLAQGIFEVRYPGRKWKGTHQFLKPGQRMVPRWRYGETMHAVDSDDDEPAAKTARPELVSGSARPVLKLVPNPQVAAEEAAKAKSAGPSSSSNAGSSNIATSSKAPAPAATTKPRPQSKGATPRPPHLPSPAR